MTPTIKESDWFTVHQTNHTIDTSTLLTILMIGPMHLKTTNISEHIGFNKQTHIMLP